jgi:hypothetical protein
VRPLGWRIWRIGLLALALATVAPPAAQAATFTAEIDRDAVAAGEPFIYRITLTVGDGDAESFRPPDFHGFQVQQAQGPSKSTSVQFVFGSNQQSVQSTYAWTYQLVLAPGVKGPLTIGAAHVRLAGRDLTTNSVRVRVGAASGQPPPAGAAANDPNRLFQRLFPGAQGFGSGRDREASSEVASSPAPAFIRVIPDKTRAFVGEQVTVAWYLYVAEVPNRFGQTSEPHTDGFWSEEIPSTNPQGRLAFGEPQSVAGRSYNVALLFKKALFPLAPGKLTITPMEAEIAHGDFFGPMQVSRLKTEPLVIEAQALPAQGQPPHLDAAFNPTNVGRYEISASVDRTVVSVGDAVTLKITVKGTGNVRNVQPPALPALAGWKSYEPKSDVALDGTETIAGTKTVEWLMRPERGGKTTIPALVLETFDPAAKRYQTARSQPIEIAVSGEAGSSAVAGSAAPSLGGAGVENVVGGSIRPIHARGSMGGEAGMAFLRSAGFKATVVTPPLALAVLVLFGRARERLGRDSHRTRRRRMRTMARRRLRAAEAHRAAGRAGDFYGEIDRVLREALSERLGTELGGLRFDELGALLRARGLPDEQTVSVVGAIEACDEARFAPAATAADPAALAAMLARAESLIGGIERAPLGEEGRG